MSKIISLALILLFVFACKKDFVVEDIDNSTLKVNAPANHLKTSTNFVTFWWDELDGAEHYELQIVTPNFSAVNLLICDTLLEKNKFSFSLSPGNYQWRLRATNAGHATKFQTFDFQIDTTSDLSNQLVNLISPATSAIVGNGPITFRWSALNSATKYRILISGSAQLDTTVLTNSLSVLVKATTNSVTAFQWNVLAKNDGSQTLFNPTARSFTIDLKPPTTPGLLLPLNGSSVAIVDTLKWVHSATAYDSIYVSEDSLFSNSQLFYSEQSYKAVSELELSPSTPGNFYWWRVRSFDVVGNGSNYSLKRKFKLLP